jgi:hypothetical protein
MLFEGPARTGPVVLKIRKPKPSKERERLIRMPLSKSSAYGIPIEAAGTNGAGHRSLSGGFALIDSVPVRSDDLNFFAADTCELYRHAEEPIFLFLIIGSESILVHYDYRGIRRAAHPRKPFAGWLPAFEL